MPPIRTASLGIPLKPVKTERTHEENQERAYIAASRRSDRSLEARIESARRASEIHKKRTGRALRVTEQDVINEEMYEEEDDDLPSQYRRIMQAIPVTQDQPFNRKLQAWFLAQHATRTALLQNEQNVNNLWAQQYPNAPHFAHYMAPQASRPFVNTQMAGSMPSPQNIPRSPSQFRHQPYPTTPSGLKTHQRAASIATPHELSSAQVAFTRPNVGTPAVTPSEDVSKADRRMSMPAVSTSSTPQSQNNQSRPPISRNPSSHQLNTFDPSASQQFPPSPSNNMNPYQQFTLQMPPQGNNTNRSFSPFSPSLPLDAQQMFSYNNDIFNQQYMMSASEMGIYDLGFEPGMDPMASQKLNQTFAPSSLDTNLPHSSMWNQASAGGMHHSAEAVDSPFTGFSDGFADMMKQQGKDFDAEGNADGSASGEQTPSGDAAWTGFLENWGESEVTT